MILGQYRSGSSAVAGLVKIIGGWDGERAVRPPNISNPTGFHEDFELDLICKSFFKIPEHSRIGDSRKLVEKLRSWRAKQEMLRPTDSKFISAKNPLFCLMTNELMTAWPDALWICVRRDPNDSIKSILHRGWEWPRENIKGCIFAMVDERDEFLRQTNHYEVNYDQLLDKPELEVLNIASHISISLNEETVRNAAKSIKPSLNRISSKKGLLARVWSMIYARILILAGGKKNRDTQDL